MISLPVQYASLIRGLRSDVVQARLEVRSSKVSAKKGGFGLKRRLQRDPFSWVTWGTVTWVKTPQSLAISFWWLVESLLLEVEDFLQWVKEIRVKFPVWSDKSRAHLKKKLAFHYGVVHNSHNPWFSEPEEFLALRTKTPRHEYARRSPSKQMRGPGRHM